MIIMYLELACLTILGIGSRDGLFPHPCVYSFICEARGLKSGTQLKLVKFIIRNHIELDMTNCHVQILVTNKPKI